VKHEERHAGVSNYSFYQLVRLNFDLITGFSIAPLQYFTMFAMASAVGSIALVVVLFVRRFVFDNLDRDAYGTFTLFGILFFLLSVAMIGIGLIGEYVGRTYQVVRARQRYHVRKIIGD
jgi:undecaprenyl-phosphate 4-deoxy-4-formamido-L-arabinose transferase